MVQQKIWAGIYQRREQKLWYTAASSRGETYLQQKQGNTAETGQSQPFWDQAHGGVEFAKMDDRGERLGRYCSALHYSHLSPLLSCSLSAPSVCNSCVFMIHLQTCSCPKDTMRQACCSARTSTSPDRASLGEGAKPNTKRPTPSTKTAKTLFRTARGKLQEPQSV